MSPDYSGDRTQDIELTLEEDFIWQSARFWRDPAAIKLDPGLDWHRAIETAVANRFQVLLKQVLEARNWMDLLPTESATALDQGVQKHEALVRLMKPALTEYLAQAARFDQEVIVLKGLWLSRKIYGLDTVRPGADIDVLLRRNDIPACLEILEDEMGYGRWWRPLLDDRFYERHHLHQQRCNHDRSIWFEPHWQLDHPYTRLTVDYEALMDRTTPAELFGQQVREMNPADLLLSLAIHLVKHAVYLPSMMDRPDLPRLILADGMLMYFVDITEAIKHDGHHIEWAHTVELARQSGAVEILGPTLQVCRDYLDAEVPDWVVEALAQPRPGRLTRAVMRRLADYKIDLYLGQQTSRAWAFLLGYNAAIVFRPIRLLDLFHYLIPGRDYLQRCYGRAAFRTALAHFLLSAGQYLQVGLDTIRFNLQRQREVRRLDRQGYHWPGPPPPLMAEDSSLPAAPDPP